ncbi:acyl-CoA Delta-9 desaturase-like [Zophobas morio]|uniref:acyl-CoA Delta-9 desaturase-like n=1 Tax=Zophobas morio TaxID=2755281 RepID=UPI003082CF4A
MVVYHLLALHGFYYMVSFRAFVATTIWATIVGETSNLGVIPGAHRLWTHRTYKAKLPLRIFLMLCNCIANQNSIYVWARDHRVHHKFTDTHADPHNINRGFFFAHMGWLLCRKHPDVIKKGKTVDMSDLENEDVVVFQRKYFRYLTFILSIFIPTVVPWYFWGEHLYVSFCLATMFRYVVSLHATWLVNSVAHLWGTKPYDGRIKPVENIIVSYITHGEGWHNYHHTFPWDYKAAELDTYRGNTHTAFIDLMAKLGLAYDLKVAPKSMIQKCKSKNESRSQDFLQGIKEKEKQLIFVENGATRQEILR